MTFYEAALQVLRESPEPLSIAEITRLALERGLIETIGHTPRQTMANVIAQSLKREQEGVELSPFKRVERGRYVLRPTDDPPPLAYLDNVIFRRHGEFLTYKEAAYEVLKTEGRPMHYAEIAQLAVEWELINPQSISPETALSAQLYRDIQQYGILSRFRREGAGVFGLLEWERDIDLITRLVEDQRRKVKQQLLNVLVNIDPFAFEDLIARLLGKMGYDDVVVTTRSKDAGIDILGEIAIGITRVKTAIQVKRSVNSIGRPIISQFRGDMLAMQQVDQGLLITTSHFTKNALEIARLPNTIPIILIDGDRLGDLMIEHQIGVRVEQIQLTSFDSDSLMIEALSE